MESVASASLPSTILNWVAVKTLKLLDVPISILEEPFVTPPIIPKSVGSAEPLVAFTFTV